jgi:hypothetical protein
MSVVVNLVISDYGLVLVRVLLWRESSRVELVLWSTAQHDDTVEYFHMSSLFCEILNAPNYAELLLLSLH